MIIKVRYRAIQWDNHQGGSGAPYTDELFIQVENSENLLSINKKVKQKLIDINNRTYTGDVELIEITIKPEMEITNALGVSNG